MLADAEGEYKKYVKNVDEFTGYNNGFTSVNTEMKGHPDYDLKQGLVEQQLVKQKKLSGEGAQFVKDRDQYGKQLGEL